jgi:hypothetical protein
MISKPTCKCEQFNFALGYSRKMQQNLYTRRNRRLCQLQLSDILCGDVDIVLFIYPKSVTV